MEIRQARLKHAGKLLAETSWPIPKVAMASGFPDADYFGTVFAREMGLTPTRYRKQHHSH